jgi:hypothetical protein
MRLDARSFRLVACVGSTHAYGGLSPALAQLTAFLEPNGRLLVGDVYWTEPPTPAYLAGWGAYEEPWLANLEAHAQANPDDADSAGMLEWAAEARARRRLGPGVLGFALVLATVPG